MKDLESIRSKSTYQQKKKIASKERGLDTLLSVYNQDSVGLAISSISIDTTDSFLDQFIFEKSERFNLINANQQLFNHRFWLFKADSNAVKNTFYNWFDQQFCQRNALLKIHSREILYRGNLVFICTNQSIHVVSSDSKIELLKWLRYIQYTENKVQFIYVCQQKKNKPALWYSFSQNKLSLIPVL